MIVALFAATILLADSTTVAPPAPAQAAASAKKKTDQPNVVCHSEQVLGSRMPVKRCRSTDEAADEKRNAREELERLQASK